MAGVDVYTDIDALLSRADIDAIIVCASTPAHAPIAAAVGRGRQHLYLEKPVALRLEEARSLESVLNARQAVCAVGFNYRLSPAFVQLREELREGRIGEIRRVRCWHCEAASAETMVGWKGARSSGGGVLVDLASHQVDFARWLLGTDVEAVEEATVSSGRSEQDDARLVLRMQGGVEVEMVLSYVQGRKHRWEVEGSRGVLRADRWPARVSGRRRPSPGGPSRLATSLRALPIPRREPSFALALGEFVGAALGESHSLPTITDGRRSLEIVLAAERAASSAP
jgi:predicted dehydrogenase